MKSSTSGRELRLTVAQSLVPVLPKEDRQASTFEWR